MIPHLIRLMILCLTPVNTHVYILSSVKIWTFVTSNKNILFISHKPYSLYNSLQASALSMIFPNLIHSTIHDQTIDQHPHPRFSLHKTEATSVNSSQK